MASLSSSGGDGARQYMHYVYILKNEKGWHYIGMTENVDKRLSFHNLGKVKSTKGHRPFRVVYQEEFPSMELARAREVFLKKNAKERERLYRLS